jgi:transposase InsO family protein
MRSHGSTNEVFRGTAGSRRAEGAEHIDWFNHRRLHGGIGMVPPVEYEQQYYSENPVIKTTKTRELSLH